MMQRRLNQSLDTEVQLRLQLGQVVPRRSQQPTRNPGMSNYSPDRSGRYSRDMSPRNNARR